MKRLKQVTTILLCLSLIMLPGYTGQMATYTIGDGDNLIESKEEFLSFLNGDKVNRNPSDFYLAADIDLGGATITPLRLNDAIFDGQNHTISNYVISKNVDKKTTDSTYVGLVRFNRGTVRNLKVKNATVKGNYVVGAVVGTNNSANGKKASVENVEVENVTIEGDTDVGGIVGNNISNTSQGNAIVDNCRLIGNVSVKATSTCGSLIGFNRATVSNSVVECNAVGWQVEATMESGGFIGENEGTVRNCKTNANCSVSNVEAGGFIGDNDGKITSCSASGQVKGSRYVGGFAGALTNYASNCTTSATVTATFSGKSYVGGFVGLNDKGVIEKSTALSNVTAKGEIVGGFVGMNINKKTRQSSCTVGSSTVSVSVKGKTDVGGFVGSNSGTRGLIKVLNCKAYASVNGKKNVGGFVGKNFGKNGYIKKGACYSKVKGKTNTGAFVGYNASGGRIQSSKKNNSRVIGKKTKFAGKNRGKIKSSK